MGGGEAISVVAAVNLKVNSPALYLLRLLRLVQCADQPRERTRSVDGDGGPAALNIELSRLELERLETYQLSLDEPVTTVTQHTRG